jgi:purine-binding chemotaxis protein CheW
VVLSELRSPSLLAVLCRVGSRVCALPAKHVLETMRPLPVEPLVGTPGFVLGASVIRGSAVPVIDAGRLLGTTESAPATRFVALRVADRFAALAVDRVLGIVALERESMMALSPLLRDASTDAVDFIGEHDAELLLVLSSARIVPEAAWAALPQAEVHE